MNPQFWWYMARASGIVAWLFVTATVLWGIILSTDLFPRHRRPRWILDLHRGLGALGVITLAVHLGSLVADNYVHFDLADLLIPFVSDWKTWQVALGVVAFWGVVIVEVTSLAMKHLPRRVWRGIHLTSYATFLLSSLHGTFAGTDATNKMYVATSIITTVALVAAVCYRVVTRGSARSSAPERRRSVRRPAGQTASPPASTDATASTLPPPTPSRPTPADGFSASSPTRSGHDGGGTTQPSR